MLQYVQQDTLEGLKENVICGHLIPAGTGQRSFEKLVVGNMEDVQKALNIARPAGVKDLWKGSNKLKWQHLAAILVCGAVAGYGLFAFF